MVTLKILSKEDIIAAYLCSLGFSQERIDGLVEVIKNKISFKAENADELIKEIDTFLLKMAKSIYPELKIDNDLLLTHFKLEFLLNNGADICAQNGVKNFELPQELIQKMQKGLFFSAPVCQYKEMKPQKIETFGSSRRKKK